jgi:hypothetical protein
MRTIHIFLDQASDFTFQFLAPEALLLLFRHRELLGFLQDDIKRTLDFSHDAYPP